VKYFAIFLFLSTYLCGQDQLPIKFLKIEDSVWVHTTYKLYNNSNLSSNGLIINTSAGLILVDTPWDDSQTVELLDLVKIKFKQDIVFAIITHAHVDRIGGISTFRKKGIKVVAIALTCQKRNSLVS
jgi:metallo-beta-lactamase class B